MDIKDLIGKTFVSVTDNGDEIIFKQADGSQITMGHIQDCCESVFVEDIIGDLSDLVGSPILEAEEVEGETEDEEYSYEVYQWTFYKIATLKGRVTIDVLQDCYSKG